MTVCNGADTYLFGVCACQCAFRFNRLNGAFLNAGGSKFRSGFLFIKNSDFCKTYPLSVTDLSPLRVMAVTANGAADDQDHREKRRRDDARNTTDPSGRHRRRVAACPGACVIRSRGHPIATIEPCSLNGSGGQSDRPLRFRSPPAAPSSLRTFGNGRMRRVRARRALLSVSHGQNFVPTSRLIVSAPRTCAGGFGTTTVDDVGA